MALISNPFIANNDKPLSPDQLTQAIRADLVGEYEAIIGYEAHAMATQNIQVQQALYKIADEERKHVGQLEEILTLLDPREGQLIDQGKQVIKQQLTNTSTQAMQENTTIPNQLNQ